MVAYAETLLQIAIYEKSVERCRKSLELFDDALKGYRISEMDPQLSNFRATSLKANGTLFGNFIQNEFCVHLSNYAAGCLAFAEIHDEDPVAVHQDLALEMSAKAIQ